MTGPLWAGRDGDDSGLFLYEVEPTPVDGGRYFYSDDGDRLKLSKALLPDLIPVQCRPVTLVYAAAPGVSGPSAEDVRTQRQSDDDAGLGDASIDDLIGGTS